MQQFINKVGYGNRQIGTAADIDRFWLQQPLQITPKEQIEFLRLFPMNWEAQTSAVGKSE